MNYGWLGKPFRNKPGQEKLESGKSKSESAACRQKTTSKKSSFCSNTIFSLGFKIKVKNITPENHSLFRSTS